MEGSKRNCRSRADSPHRQVAQRFFQFQVDVLWEILLRLPIEALLMCQSVCKTWYDVVKSPTFIIRQMNRSSKQPLRFICINKFLSPVRTLQSSSLQHANDGARRLLLLDTEGGKARKMPRYEHTGKRIIFSHNGLICLVGNGCLNRSTFSICNPVTSVSLELTRGVDLKDGDYCQVGFCYVSARQTYIIVHASVIQTKPYGRVTLFHMKTSGQGSWQRLAHPERLTKDHKIEETVYWSGAFYWKIKKGHKILGRDECILRFDTVHETFQIIPYPDDIFREHSHPVHIILNHLKLLVLNGRLTLIERGANTMKLWEVIGERVGEFRLVCRERYDNIHGAYTLVSRVSDNENVLTYCYSVAEHGRTFKDFVVASNDMQPYKTLEIDGLPVHFNTVTINPSLFSPHSMGII